MLSRRLKPIVHGLKSGRTLASVLLLAVLAGCASLDQLAPIESRAPAAEPAPPAAPPAARQDPNAALRDKLYAAYRQWRGTPYRRGGLSKQGVDCSGLVYLTVKATRGVALPRSTDQQASAGERIDRDELQTGDLVFFKTGVFDRHVGIYMEDGRFLHVSEAGGVMISALDDAYWKSRYWQARRLDP